MPRSVPPNQYCKRAFIHLHHSWMHSQPDLDSMILGSDSIFHFRNSDFQKARIYYPNQAWFVSVPKMGSLWWSLSLVTIAAFAYSSTSADAQASRFNAAARWISPVEKVPNGTFAAYRYNVTVPASTEGACKNSTMLIAADTKYWLYINGVLVVFEGGLKRGPTPTGGYFDVVELATDNLKEGVNTIAILALYLGRRTGKRIAPPTRWSGGAGVQ